MKKEVIIKFYKNRHSMYTYLDFLHRELFNGGLGIVVLSPTSSSFRKYFCVCVHWGSNLAVSKVIRAQDDIPIYKVASRP